MPRVSVILPVYNAETFLKESINSILNQTYGDFELLIYNDGSNDGSEKIINEFNDNRIIYNKFNENVGLIEVLNTGLQHSKGEFIARMDADDICDKTRFEKQVQFLDQNIEVGVLGTQIKLLESGKRILRPTDDEDLRWFIFKGSPVAHPSVMIRQSVLTQNNLKYNENAYLVEDFDLWWNMGFSTKLANLDETLLDYRVHSNQESSKSELQNENLYKNQNQFIESLGLSHLDFDIKFIQDLLTLNLKFNATEFNKIQNFFHELTYSKKAVEFFGYQQILKKQLQIQSDFIRNINQYEFQFLRNLKFQSFRKSLNKSGQNALVFLIKCLIKWQTRK